ncbi:MAG: hypothetical protein IT305_09240 [Chloroflexi bacterium]|nr:hypothetical protein [Chloroflexota bacterium]
MRTPILAGLLRPDQNPGAARRLAGLAGFAAALLGLTVRFDLLALFLLGLASIVLVGIATNLGRDRCFRRFALINGIAFLSFYWGTTQQANLTLELTPDRLSASVGGVTLAAARGDVPLTRVALSLASVEEQPAVAPWVYQRWPGLEAVALWLAGGMRGGLHHVEIADARGAPVVATLPGVWQPNRPLEAPLVPTLPDGWSVGRDPAGRVTLVAGLDGASTIAAPLTRPGGELWLALTPDASDSGLVVAIAPDRRSFEIRERADDGAETRLVGGPLAYQGSALGWLQAVLRDLGRCWLVALGLLGLASALTVAIPATMVGGPPILWRLVTAAGALALGLATLGLTAAVATYVLEGLPHADESIAALFEAQTMAHEGIWAPAPGLSHFFEQPNVVIVDGRWFGAVAPGWPLLLSLGVPEGLASLVSPIILGVAVALVVVAGRLLYGTGTGLLAGLLLAFSPFALTLAGDLLPQPAGLTWTLLLLVLAALAMRWRRWPLFLLTGLAFGVLLATRPLTGLGVGVPLVVALVAAIRCERRILVPRLVLLAVGVLPPLVYFWTFNAALTGDALTTPAQTYLAGGQLGFGPGVGPLDRHDLADALANLRANVASLLRVLYGWPSYLTLSLAFVPLVIPSRDRWDRVLAASILGSIVANLFYGRDGLLYGPRLYFEAIGPLALLTARGASFLATPFVLRPARCTSRPAAVPAPSPSSAAASTAAASTAPAHRPATSTPSAHSPEGHVAPALSASTGELAPAGAESARPLRPSALSPVSALLAILFALDLVTFLPDSLLAHRGYNGISRAGLATVEEAGVQQALVFVVDSDPAVQAYAEVFPANGPFLAGPVIFARDLGDEENFRLITRYPDWSAWRLEDHHLSAIPR